MHHEPTRMKYEAGLSTLLRPALPVLVGVLGAVGVLTYGVPGAFAGGYGGYEINFQVDYSNISIPEITPGAGAEVESTTITIGDGTTSGHQYSVQLNKTLWYAWNRFMTPSNTDTAIQGYVSALSQPNITIGYDIGIFDAETGARIPENGTVSVGDKIELRFGKFRSQDIFWFGTGYSMDSPYGEWRADAAAPARVGGKVACEDKDMLVRYHLPGYGLDFNVYIPLVVNPPSRTFASIPGNLDCDPVQEAGGMLKRKCTVTDSGDIKPKFNFAATYGKFYYRYYDFRSGMSGCFGNNIPLTDSFGQANGPVYNNVTTIQAPYVLQLPAQSFTYAIKATGTSSKPTEPALSCPTEMVPPGDNVIIRLSSSDPENDKVRYGADWIEDAVKEVNSGWTELMNDDTQATLTKVGGYTVAGEYTVYARAEDATGALSPWASCDIRVGTGGTGGDGDGDDETGDDGTDTDAPRPTVDLQAFPAIVDAGLPAILTWSSENADTCTGTGFSTGGLADNAAGVSVVPSGDATYRIVCTGRGGTGEDYASVGTSRPEATFVAEPSLIAAGGSARLSWTTSDMASCRISAPGGYFYTVPSAARDQGSIQINNIQGRTLYTLACDTEGGELVTKNAEVDVAPDFEEF